MRQKEIKVVKVVMIINVEGKRGRYQKIYGLRIT